MSTSARAFVLRHTRLQEVPDLGGIRLHLADDVLDLWRATHEQTGARANGQRLDVICAEILDDEPPDVDVILAGDCWYEEHFATRITAWLQRAYDRGVDVRIGDPDRRYLPHDAVRRIATYEVRSTTDLEDLGRNHASVHELHGKPGAAR